MRPTHQLAAAAFVGKDWRSLLQVQRLRPTFGVPFAIDPTPDTPLTAMWVEDTGSPSQDAMMPVIAADKATQ
jgi:hypothetical protein